MYRIGILVLLALGLSACGVTDRAGRKMGDSWVNDMMFSSPDRLRMTIDGGNQLNTVTDGEPLSVVVRVYQLSRLEPFVAASADALWTVPQQTMGATVLDTRELTVLPGIGHVEDWPLGDATRFVGVAAFFHDTSEQPWKIAFAADSLRKDGLWFSPDGVRVLLEGSRVVAASGVDVLDGVARWSDPELDNTEVALEVDETPSPSPAEVVL